MDQNTPKRIALIGIHCPSYLVEKLISDGYSISRSATFAEIDLNDAAFTAIVITGHDEAFANSSVQIATLLRSHYVLVLFNPSAGVLKAVREAAQTIIDVEAMKFFEGDSLIIHRVPNDVGIYITPVNLGAESTRDAISTTEGTACVLEQQKFSAYKTISLLNAGIERILQGESQGESKIQPDQVNALQPPPNTQFFFKTVLSLSHQFVPYGYNQRFDVNWTLSLYCYATEANPTQPDFEAKGGKVYVIAVNDGYVARSPSHDPRVVSKGFPSSMIWFLDSVQFAAEGLPPLIKDGLYPDSDTSIYEYLYKYDTQFLQTVNLWRNDQKFSHDLRYEESFSHQDFRQTTIPVADKLGFSIDYKNIYDVAAGDRDNSSWLDQVYDESYDIKPFPPDHLRLHGLFTFTSGLGKPSLNLSFSAAAVGFEHGYSCKTKNLVCMSAPSQTYPLDLTFGSNE